MEVEVPRFTYLVARVIGGAIPLILGIWLTIRWHRRGERLGWLWGGLIALVGILVLAAVVILSLLETKYLEPEEVLAAPPGYRLQAVPQAQAQTERRLFSDPDLGDDLEGVAVREIVREEGGIGGSATVMALDPLVAGDPGKEEEFIQAFRQLTGVDPTPVILEGQQMFWFLVRAAENVRSLHYLAWRYENLFIVVESQDQNASTAIASAMVRQAP